ncbi:MAG: type II secretion system GspH family protein [Proteobacteria bacterium]|nr:type II secretion system GspH family protein [Pseudomonadota bacterium]
MRQRLNDQRGFTLVEIIAVLILIGILAAVAVPKYIDLTANAKVRAIQAGVAELNGRESLTWANVKLSTAGWTTDAALFLTMDTVLGTDNYTWSAAPTVTGGTLIFQTDTSQVLVRTASTLTSPGSWR